MQQVGGELASVLGELLRRAPAQEAVRLAWPLVCGPKVAARTRTLDLATGVLRVEVPDKSWAGQLLLLEQTYTREFARLLGSDLVRSIKFVLPR
jgi:predicted nucleic acid-binding Zn ribbon protein